MKKLLLIIDLGLATACGNKKEVYNSNNALENNQSNIGGTGLWKTSDGKRSPSSKVYVTTYNFSGSSTERMLVDGIWTEYPITYTLDGNRIKSDVDSDEILYIDENTMITNYTRNVMYQEITTGYRVKDLYSKDMLGIWYAEVDTFSNWDAQNTSYLYTSDGQWSAFKEGEVIYEGKYHLYGDLVVFDNLVCDISFETNGAERIMILKEYADNGTVYTNRYTKVTSIKQDQIIGK